MLLMARHVNEVTSFYSVIDCYDEEFDSIKCNVVSLFVVDSA